MLCDSACISQCSFHAFSSVISMWFVRYFLAMLPDFAVFKTDATSISQSDIYCSCIVLSCIIFQYFRHKHYTDFSSTFILTCVYWQLDLIQLCVWSSFSVSPNRGMWYFLTLLRSMWSFHQRWVLHSDNCDM